MANDLRLEMVGTEDNLLKKGFVEQVSFQSWMKKWSGIIDNEITWGEKDVTLWESRWVEEVTDLENKAEEKGGATWFHRQGEA